MLHLYENRYKWASYSKYLARMTGSVLGSIILQQVIERYKENNYKAFPWFDRPTDHKHYTNGRSWEESTGLTGDDLAYGLSIVATKITEKNTREMILEDSKVAFNTKGKMIYSKKLVLYKKMSGYYWYEPNMNILGQTLELFHTGDWKNHISTEIILSGEKLLRETIDG